MSLKETFSDRMKRKDAVSKGPQKVRNRGLIGSFTYKRMNYGGKDRD